MRDFLALDIGASGAPTNAAARNGAIASFKLRHIDIDQDQIDQGAREARTKFSKSFVTTFFSVGDDMRVVVADWVAYLRTEKLWGLDDPLFPATKIAVGDNLRFGAVGLGRKHWSNTGPIRKIFKDAFASAGLPRPTIFGRTRAASFLNTIVGQGRNKGRSAFEN